MNGRKLQTRWESLVTVALVLVLLTPVSEAATESQIVDAARSNGADWVAWAVPATSGLRVTACCYHYGKPTGSCTLSRGGGWSVDDEREPIRSYEVYARVAGGEISKIRIYDERCRVDASADRLVRIEMTAAQSVALFDELIETMGEATEDALGAMAWARDPSVGERLRRHLSSHPSGEVRGGAGFHLAFREGNGALPALRDRLRRESDDDVREKLVFAVSRVGDDDALDLLGRIALDDEEPDIRQQALFWIANEWKRDGIALIERAFDDEDRQVREHAVFALSQISGRDVTRMLADLARTGRDESVRKSALFWLSQRAAEQAAPLLEEVIYSEEDEEVLEAAVFAVSQLGEEGLPILIRLAESHANPEVREKSIFWLGQSGDPRAVAALERIALRN